ncbi:MBL fold metallo-hydrolase [Pseudoflavitalea rhizosphaerae]|uniref:MBL fold metallo-hydrolase n=1 Tax=Pseudoflavitalea rhizosphaerae TaxID=1884793 RepID=UPI000F8ED1E9|nr:MBL fold metallo-hydrolase [Pseudoflavitalea rhizosphaerae]
MKIIPIKEGNYAVNKKKEFTLLKEGDKIEYSKMAIQPFLVVTENDHILLDTGLHFSHLQEPLIFQSLQKENIQPEQITKVLLSHLHKDHADGLGQVNEHSFHCNFPAAQIYIQQRELDFALQQHQNPSYNIPLLEKLHLLPNIVWMNDDKGQITDEISFEVTGGHSPFHQSFRIRANGETAFYGADNLPLKSYLKMPIAYKTDYDGKKAKELRLQWEKSAIAEHWFVLFYHDMKTPVVQF